MRAPINTYTCFWGGSSDLYRAADVIIGIRSRHPQSHGKTKHFASAILKRHIHIYIYTAHTSAHIQNFFDETPYIHIYIYIHGAYLGACGFFLQNCKFWSPKGRQPAHIQKCLAHTWRISRNAPRGAGPKAGRVFLLFFHMFSYEMVGHVLFPAMRRIPSDTTHLSVGRCRPVATCHLARQYDRKEKRQRLFAK